MKEMFFLLTYTPVKLHSNGSHRLQQEIHLLSDSFWKNSLPSWFTWNVTTKSQLLFIFHFFNSEPFSDISEANFRIANLAALFGWGGKTAFRLTNCQRKEIFPCHLVRRWIYGVFQSGQSIQTSEKELTAPVGLNGIVLICHQFSFKEGVPKMVCRAIKIAIPPIKHSVRVSCYCVLVCILRQSLLESHYWSDGNMDDLIVWLDIILHVSPFVHNPSSRFVALLLNDAWHHQPEDWNPWSGSIHCHKSRLAGTMKPKRPAKPSHVMFRSSYEISTCNIWWSILYHFTQLNLYFWRSNPPKTRPFPLQSKPRCLGRPCEPPLPPPLPRAPSGGETSSERLGQRWPPSTGATLEDVVELFLLGGSLR